MSDTKFGGIIEIDWLDYNNHNDLTKEQYLHAVQHKDEMSLSLKEAEIRLSNTQQQVELIKQFINCLEGIEEYKGEPIWVEDRDGNISDEDLKNAYCFEVNISSYLHKRFSYVYLNLETFLEDEDNSMYFEDMPVEQKKEMLSGANWSIFFYDRDSKIYSLRKGAYMPILLKREEALEISKDWVAFGKLPEALLEAYVCLKGKF